MVEELLNELEIESASPLLGGYCLAAKVHNTFMEFYFLVQGERVWGYHQKDWLELTEGTQEFIRAKFIGYQQNHPSLTHAWVS